MLDNNEIKSNRNYKYTYCFCVSGHLGYLVLRYLNSQNLPISLVLTDSNSVEIIEYCLDNEIVCFKGNPRNGKALAYIDCNKLSFDILLSVNYLFIIESDLINKAKLHSINIHGSLLPKYRGRCPNVWAIINGESIEGITAHHITELCDEGDIIKQISLPISDEATGYDLLVRAYDYYPKWTYELVIDIESGNFKSFSQDQTKATFFGKRTPADGQINWNWQKERIRNWVRAQAQPYYPGAFSSINGEKIIINKISYSDLGYSWDMPNGLVVNIQSTRPLVKTPNGVVALEDYIFENPIVEGNILK
ncbi:formyl transferase domain protein [Bacteroides helcogenes P 36-108]|uniref:Formyl transferase domain protein n=1 Tax=Bacteroides helcogenes (strain ATCC 35417 / DSM 20613 / JCM 6297 / CCUG 15421 / P 36-108) TaxID=693979 RepID=E6SQ63_BACT6|nr:formyl transferase domain protein [Bacteroides helcogenes P 36-108]